MDKLRYTITIIEENEIKDICLNDYNKNIISFGRGLNNDIKLSSLLVSSNHGYFEFLENGVKVVDNNSTNGIFINNNKVDSAILKDGDSIKIDNPDEPLDKGIIMIFTLGDIVNKWQQYDLNSKDIISIGRDNSCDIVLDHVSIALNQVNIYKKDNKFILNVINSNNNVFINGKLVNGNFILKDRDVILISNAKLIYSKGRIIYQMYDKGVSVDAVDIVKTVKVRGKKRDISYHVNLSIKPGQFVAFVGGSGAGKTTFMNCISGVSKPTSGKVYINGNDLFENYATLKKIIGYVPQDDIVFNDLTLFDMLKYSANLRMPDDSSSIEKNNRIDEVLKIVELTDKKDVMIKNLSGGQRKRASIAVELLADPKLFFLDEPTSGLDPGTERNLMNILRKMANSGKTIILVTHNTLNLHLCDKIVFFGPGGKLCFAGSPSDTLNFFGVNDFVDIYNLLNNDPDKWYQTYNNSKYFEKVEIKESLSSSQQKTKNNRSFFKQFITLSKRYIKTIINDKQMLMLLLLQAPFIAYMFVLVAPDDMFEGYENTKMMLFAMSIAAIWLGTLNSIQVICKERAILKREYMADLRLSAYFASKLFVQIILSIIQSILFIGCFVILFGFVPDNGIITNWTLEMIFIFFLIIVSSTCLGLLLSAFAKSPATAVVLAPIALIPQLVLNGSFLPLNGLLDKFSNIVLDKWAIQLFGITCDLNSIPDALQKLSPNYVRELEDYYLFDVNHFFNDIFIVILLSLITLFICYFVLKRQLDNRR